MQAHPLKAGPSPITLPQACVTEGASDCNWTTEAAASADNALIAAIGFGN
jgi:hypothetical protein